MAHDYTVWTACARVHWPVADPPRVPATARLTGQDRRQVVRQVRTDRSGAGGTVQILGRCSADGTDAVDHRLADRCGVYRARLGVGHGQLITGSDAQAAPVRDSAPGGRDISQGLGPVRTLKGASLAPAERVTSTSRVQPTP